MAPRLPAERAWPRGDAGRGSLWNTGAIDAGLAKALFGGTPEEQDRRQQEEETLIHESKPAKGAEASLDELDLALIDAHGVALALRLKAPGEQPFKWLSPALSGLPFHHHPGSPDSKTEGPTGQRRSTGTRCPRQDRPEPPLTPRCSA